jgi:hypothetical protein
MMRDTNTVPDAIKRLAGQLSAARAARLADQNTHPTLRLMIEAQQRAAAFDDAQQPEPKPTRTRQRKPTVASVIRQMQRAGMEIAGCEINQRDCTVKVISGKPVGDIDVNDTASSDPKWN